MNKEGQGGAWGAIFDWDGVVVDSSAYHERSWETTATELGLPLPEGHFLRGFGMKNEVIIPGILGWAQDREGIARLADAKERAYRRLVREGGLPALPGVQVFLERLHEAGVPVVIASSTGRENIECGLNSTGLRELFPQIVSGCDVTHGKPDPEVFLLAAARIGMPPARCIVFEDAHVGIQAARAAGMKVVAVTTTHPAADLRRADRVVSRLDELSIEELSGLFDEHAP